MIPAPERNQNIPDLLPENPPEPDPNINRASDIRDIINDLITEVEMVSDLLAEWRSLDSADHDSVIRFIDQVHPQWRDTELQVLLRDLKLRMGE